MALLYIIVFIFAFTQVIPTYCKETRNCRPGKINTKASEFYPEYVACIYNLTFSTFIEKNHTDRHGGACNPVIPEVESLRQVDHCEFEVILGYIVRLCLKKQKQKHKDHTIQMSFNIFLHLTTSFEWL